MPKAGYFTVLGILLLATGMAIFNLLYQRQRSTHTGAYWGDERLAIVAAECVDIILLEPENPSNARQNDEGQFTIALQKYREVQSKEGSQAPGLLHVRRALVDDGAFQWDAAPRPTEDTRYRYALRFSEPGRSPATVLFSGDGMWVYLLGADRPIAVRPNAQQTSPFLAFLEEQFVERPRP